MPAARTKRQRSQPRARAAGSRRYGAVVTLGPVRVRREVLRGPGWQTAKWPAFLLIGLLAGLLYVGLAFDAFYVYDANIIGAKLLTAEEVYQAAGLEGYSIFWLDQQEIAERLRNRLPYVTQATVRLQLPNRVAIQVEERRPRIVWETNQGQAWVDEQGVALPPLPAAAPPPMVRLLDSQQTALAPLAAGETQEVGPGGLPVVHMQAEVVQALLGLQGLLPDVQVYRFDAQNGLNFTTADGVSVIFGLKGDLAHKTTILQAIQTEWKDAGRQLSLIDLRVVERPYVR